MEFSESTQNSITDQRPPLEGATPIILKKKPNIALIIGISLLLVTVIPATGYFGYKNFRPSRELVSAPNLNEAPVEVVSPSPIATVNPQVSAATPTITSKQKVSPTATPSPTPTPRVPSPPIMEISYPSEMQSVEFTSSSQKLCVVDTPKGGNTSGLQRRHNINDTSWSSYSDIYTLCFDPKEGLNRFQVQYKNNYGEESTTHTRQFNFHMVNDINISLSGVIYRDINCNGAKDNGESSIGTTATINIFKLPEFYIYKTVNSDSSGSYSYSGSIKESDTLILQPILVSPSGYKGNPDYTSPSINFSASNKNAIIDIPQVPNEFIEACQ